ncbi:23S rRNA (uracil(747)-C(5))-methyltransferase RlmC [Pseudarthrobacter sp. J1738]|uniref:23S rRNA (uracil(747)-C(5))-methyltransferase RlmC n=1 Tax=Pseudarthrobacter sp. J1738 TaxID=3420446 RepID=UPI003D2B9608
MQCSYFDARTCVSCTLMGQPYSEQLADKESHCRSLLGGHRELEWLPAVASSEDGFRNKAKMVIAGSVQEPTIGILDRAGNGVDLRMCGVCSPALRETFPSISAFITLAGLTPYSVPERRGELKYILLTESADGELMLRFVLRSTNLVSKISKYLPALLEAIPGLRVVTANILPEHKAVLEGEEEIVLTGESTLRMRVNDVNLHLRPKSFFQTNTEIAAALYRQGREWVNEANPASIWDLYCGVGGFALHSTALHRKVTGIELSEEAIVSAQLSAHEAGLTGTHFRAGDATAFAVAADKGDVPELVIVNPPRRGIGAELASWLENSTVQHLVYSSCNAVTLAKDLEAMPSFTPRRARVLDMFPQTKHYEVMVLLERAN